MSGGPGRGSRFLKILLIKKCDGQCDSPGHTAKNLCYFLMELVSGYILEAEVKDKRHVNLMSVNMEKRALECTSAAYIKES